MLTSFGGGRKSDKLKRVGDSTVSKTIELEEEKEEMEETVLGGGGVSTMYVVYHCGLVSVSSLSSILYIGSSSKPSRSSLPLSLGSRHIQDYLKKKRGGKRKFVKLYQEKARHD